MGFTTIKPEEYDEKTFGLCIREKREMLNKSVRGLAKEIGMSAVYLSDIERGNRPAPTGLISKRDYMADLVKALELTPEEETAFYSMAKVTNSCLEQYKDYLARTPDARVALRLAGENNASLEIWREFIKLLNEKNSEK